MFVYNVSDHSSKLTEKYKNREKKLTSIIHIIFLCCHCTEDEEKYDRPGEIFCHYYVFSALSEKKFEFHDSDM